MPGRPADAHKRSYERATLVCMRLHPLQNPHPGFYLDVIINEDWAIYHQEEASGSELIAWLRVMRHLVIGILQPKFCRAWTHREASDSMFCVFPTQDGVHVPGNQCKYLKGHWCAHRAIQQWLPQAVAFPAPDGDLC